MKLWSWKRAHQPFTCSCNIRCVACLPAVSIYLRSLTHAHALSLNMYDFILSVSVKTIRFLKIRSCSSFYFAWVLPDITEMKACCWLALMFNSSTEIISTSTAAVLG